MIVSRYEQRTIYETAVALMPDHKELLWEDWMLEVDSLLEDRDLIGIVQTALEKRCPKSATLGRIGTPAEVAAEVLLRLKTLGKDGGLIIGPTHHVQLDTPMENFWAMINTITETTY